MAHFGDWFQQFFLHLRPYIYTFSQLQLKDKINAYTNKHGKNPDNASETNSTARRLKLKLYNTIKSKRLALKNSNIY